MSDKKNLAVRLNHLPLWLLRRIQAAERQCRANPEHEPSQVCNSWQAAMWLESWVGQHVNDSNWLDHWGSTPNEHALEWYATGYRWWGNCEQCE